MTNWRYTVDIKQHLGDAMHGEEFFKVRAAVAAELKQARDYKDDFELQGIVDELETTVNGYDFNDVLNELYDWADARLVWMEI